VRTEEVTSYVPAVSLSGSRVLEKNEKEREIWISKAEDIGDFGKTGGP